MGLSFYAIAYLRDATLDSFCPTSLDPSRFVFYEEASSIVAGTDERLLKLTSYYMCSEVCPCPLYSDDGSMNYLTDYIDTLDEAKLNLFERTHQEGTDFLQFNFVDQTSLKTFTSFKECFEMVIDGSYDISGVQDGDMIKEEFITLQ